MNDSKYPQGFYTQLHSLNLNDIDLRDALVEPNNEVLVILYNGERIRLAKGRNDLWTYHSNQIGAASVVAHSNMITKDLKMLLDQVNYECVRCNEVEPRLMTSHYDFESRICNGCHLIEELEEIQGSKFDDIHKYWRE